MYIDVFRVKKKKKKKSVTVLEAINNEYIGGNKARSRAVALPHIFLFFFSLKGEASLVHLLSLDSS